MFIFTVVKNLALNKRTRGPDLPQYCTNFGKLILRKVIKIATRCHILKLKCTKFDFGWGSAGGAYSAPQTPAGFKELTPKEGRGREGREGEDKGGQGKGVGRERGRREGREREKGSEGMGRRWREGKENVDRPPTVFGLKVALDKTY